MIVLENGEWIRPGRRSIISLMKRVAQGLEPLPSAASIDSQSVKQQPLPLHRLVGARKSKGLALKLIVLNGQLTIVESHHNS
jgi:hypothetical protein